MPPVIRCIRDFEQFRGAPIYLKHALTGDRFRATGLLEVKVTKETDSQKNIEGQLKIVGVPESGMGDPVELGVLTVNYETVARDLELQGTDTVAPFQRQGLMTAAVELALREFPETKTMTASLLGSNRTAFDKKLRELGGRRTEENIYEAMKATPIYKQMAAQGFSEVVPIDSYFNPFELDINQLVVRTRRPKPN